MSSDEPLRNPESFPTEGTTVLLRGPAGDIEALTDVPETGSEVGAVAILCHSLSDDGGTMHGKVVQMMERAMREMGARTVRFNFRGAGASEGDPNGGYGEAEDVIHVASWVLKTCPDHEIWLGGFGFGCYVTIRAAQKVNAAQLISVAPPVEAYDFESLPRPQCPWLIVQGDEDEKTNPDAVYKWVEAMDDGPQLIRMEETDHLFHRRLMDLRGVIKNGIRRQRPAEAE